jgi:aminoglycoside N3'-acetyltransferase
MGIRSELSAQLRALGVAPGDLLMVHASMRAVGTRAEDLIAALQASVSPSGALMMLLCGPEGAPFEGDASPAWRELGILPEVFRRTPGVVLNLHPIARFGAWGAPAALLVENPPQDDYYGPGSPLARLWECGGKVLRLGADLDTVTLLHWAEYLADLPQKRRVTHIGECARAGAVERIEVTCLDDSEGIRDWPGDDYFAEILRLFLASGAAPVGPVGGATAELLVAQDLVRFGVAWLESELA